MFLGFLSLIRVFNAKASWYSGCTFETHFALSDGKINSDFSFFRNSIVLKYALNINFNKELWDKQGSDSSILDNSSPAMIIFLFVFSCKTFLAFLIQHKLYSSDWVKKWYDSKNNS